MQNSVICSLAAKTDFSNYSEDQAIVDQLISSTKNDVIRDRLLLKGDALSLNRALEIAMKVETAYQESKKLSSVCHGSTAINSSTKDGMRFITEAMWPGSVDIHKPPTMYIN